MIMFVSFQFYMNELFEAFQRKVDEKLLQLILTLLFLVPQENYQYWKVCTWDTLKL